jgi:hypothetical protein
MSKSRNVLTNSDMAWDIIEDYGYELFVASDKLNQAGFFLRKDPKLLEAGSNFYSYSDGDVFIYDRLAQLYYRGERELELGIDEMLSELEGESSLARIKVIYGLVHLRAQQPTEDEVKIRLKDLRESYKILGKKEKSRLIPRVS